MVTATPTNALSSSQTTILKVKVPSSKSGSRSQNLLIRSQPIVLDFDAFPAPTSPLPVPKQFISTTPTVSPRPSRTPPVKPLIERVPSSPPGLMTTSLKPPPRPRSIVSQLTLSKPPSESLPPIPSLLHSNELSSSTPTSPTTPTTPLLYPSFTSRYEIPALSSPPSNSIRSSSVGRVHGNFKTRTPRKISNAYAIPVQKEEERGRPLSNSTRAAVPPQKIDFTDKVANTEEPINKDLAPKAETNEDERRISNAEIPRPVGLIATRFYGIESSMRWREGVDPIQKRFASSNGSWRCQDRFAVFFRPGDQIGPDQVVTKTFWSEAWPYPIETILYGTTDSLSSSARSSRTLDGGNRSDHETDLVPKLKSSLRQTSSETQLKNVASFPPTSQSKDPRYINSDGVIKIAKVTIPMPDVSIDQIDLVKSPVKVELRIFIIENPLRIHASAFLLGRTVSGTTELYV